jgi:hypothetical protein
VTGDAPILCHGSSTSAPMTIHSPGETDSVPGAKSVVGGVGAGVDVHLLDDAV